MNSIRRLLIPLFAIGFAIACAHDPIEGETDNNTGNINPDVTVRGLVYGEGNKTLAGVVVSDGLSCVQTDKNGYFELCSDLSRTKFIMVSIPSGYKAPVDQNGLPQFFHRVTDQEREANMCEHTFELYPINNNPDKYTLIVGADPQPRARTAGFDNIAYHSLDICELLYRDMKEKTESMAGRNLFGLMLGDVVHENMTLYDDYLSGMKTLGFPMFNVIGNHDNDPNAANDSEGAHVFEEKLGPTYYSYNIGKQHYVVLDNLIMRVNEEGSLRDYDQGLTDEIWQWLQNDLAFVDLSTTLMVAAHSPLFMTSGMSDRSQSSGTRHGKDYAQLLSRYNKVHTWNGHHHTTFNYVYPEGHRFENIEVHNVCRSSGELWTNEWAATGTPRGYTIVEVDGDDISWYFKPMIYQSAFTGKSPEPEYKHRDWDYDANGVAKMRTDGSTLSESYQMHVFKPGEYYRNFKEQLAGNEPDDNYLYVDVFLWDDKWQVPRFNGQRMTKVDYGEAYSIVEYEFRSHYYTCGYKLKDYASYVPRDGDIHTIFKIYVGSTSSGGTVTVTDRFGQEFSSSVSW